jgi:hypothetical protein
MSMSDTSTGNQSQNGITDTGNGLLVGVQPATPRQQEWTGQQPPAQPQPQQAPEIPQGFFTQEQLENARRQEKEKLYPQIDEMKTQLRTLQEEREAELAEKQRLADEAESARRAKEESEMDLRALIEKRDADYRAQLEERDRRYEADRAVFEQERRLAQVTDYRRDRLEQEQEYIIPELREFVSGSSPDEIDQSIEAMKERTAAIVANFTAAQPPPVPFRGGAMPSTPPVGPMEQLPSYEQLTPEVIKGMTMDQYKQNREQLLRATSPRRGQ